MRLLTRLAIDLALWMRQPLTSFCDINTADEQELITHNGDAATVVHIVGVRRTLDDMDIDRVAAGLRLDLSGVFDQPGHVMQWWFGADPDLAAAEIRRKLGPPRAVAHQVGLDFDFIFAERQARLPTMMRWEACYLVLWTRRGSALTRAENRLASQRIDAARAGMPDLGDAQMPFLSTDEVLSRHRSYVSRVLGALRQQQVVHQQITPRQMIASMREAYLPETVGGEWTPNLPGDPVMARAQDAGSPVTAEGVVWPNLAEQIITEGGKRLSLTTARIGVNDWAGLDMWIGPEQPQSFARLVHTLALERIPWRCSFLIEGGGELAFSLKAVAAQLLHFLPANRAIWKGIEANQALRDQQKDVMVRFRASFATWAPAGEAGTLQRRRAALEHRVQTWGNLKAKYIAGDPVAGVFSSSFGFAAASTAKPAQAPLGDVLRMMPWCRPGSPWTSGPVLFRSPDGRICPFDPTSLRIKATNAYIGPSRHGKSVLANTNLIGLCTSAAAIGRHGARLPLIGKIDVERSAEGAVILLREALPKHRRGEAVFFQLRETPQHAVNMLDTHLACERPLPRERMAQRNFLSLVARGAGGEPVDGMGQLIAITLREAYRNLGTEGDNISPKRYHPGADVVVDAALARIGAKLPDRPYWWEAVRALCDAGDYTAAERANRQAVPVLEDLIAAAHSDRVKQIFRRVVPRNVETLLDLFDRNLKAFINDFPHLNQPTQLDFGQARVVVLDLAAVAPTGSPEAEWQTSIYYMIARHLVGRRLFVRPDDADFAPEHIRAWLREQFAEVHEAVKCLEYDELHRLAKQPEAMAQLDRDDREAARYGVHIGVSSQHLTDLSEHLQRHATAYWICGVGDSDEADQMADRLRLQPGTRMIIRDRLKGPDPTFGGAPFVVVMDAAGARWEQMWVNSLGPVELWALSTTSEDAALRDNLYGRLGFREALQRLAKVFPGGSAVKEVERRKAVRIARGEDGERAERGVVQELADEIANGVGLGAVIREPATAAVAAE